MSARLTVTRADLSLRVFVCVLVWEKESVGTFTVLIVFLAPRLLQAPQFVCEGR